LSASNVIADTDIASGGGIPCRGQSAASARRRLWLLRILRCSGAMMKLPKLATGIAEKKIHKIFEVALLLKAALSVFEIVGGAVLFLTTRQIVFSIADFLTRSELGEDPDDTIARYIFGTAQGLTEADKASAAFFLLSHGTIKLFLVSAVMRGYLWAYPVFMLALALLIAYQSYQLARGFSVSLIALTCLDAAVLGLTWHEYRLVRKRRS
jgi:uncharacterized membrane protein